MVWRCDDGHASAAGSRSALVNRHVLKPVFDMPPGRPRKYETEAERRLASNASKRASYQRSTCLHASVTAQFIYIPYRNSAAITRRRRFKRTQRLRELREQDLPQALEDGCAVESDFVAEQQVATKSNPSPLQVFIEANPVSPAHPLQDQLCNALEAAPSPTNSVEACGYWRPIVRMMRGRQWGEFAYKHLVIPDGEQYRQRMKDFKDVLFAVDKLAIIAGKIQDAAFDIDPSGTKGPFLDAKWLLRDVGFASLHLEEIVSLRCEDLHSLQSLGNRGMLEFQRVQ